MTSFCLKTWTHISFKMSKLEKVHRYGKTGSKYPKPTNEFHYFGVLTVQSGQPRPFNRDNLDRSFGTVSTVRASEKNLLSMFCGRENIFIVKEIYFSPLTYSLFWCLNRSIGTVSTVRPSEKTCCQCFVVVKIFSLRKRYTLALP